MLMPFMKYTTTYICPRCRSVGFYPGRPEVMRCQKCDSRMDVVRTSNNWKGMAVVIAVGLVGFLVYILVQRA
jgi:RNA polymerase subunit RPABC4/transcription elongation factor Spt4